MAYYQALCSQGMSRESALAYVRQETRKAAEIKQEEMKKLAKLPFAYMIYRMGVKSHMKKNFPDEGWTTEWVRNGFDVTIRRSTLICGNASTGS